MEQRLTCQLSDDSDIEEHPNVDKKSMIRWAYTLVSFLEVELTSAGGSRETSMRSENNVE